MMLSNLNLLVDLCVMYIRSIKNAMGLNNIERMNYSRRTEPSRTTIADQKPKREMTDMTSQTRFPPNTLCSFEYANNEL